MTQPKTSRLNVRLSQRDADLIGQRAARSGLSTSEYVRRCTLRDPDRPAIVTDVDLLRSLYSCLRKCGGNLNQVAHELHISHQPQLLEPELGLAIQSVGKASEDVAAFIADARDSV